MNAACAAKLLTGEMSHTVCQQLPFRHVQAIQAEASSIEERSETSLSKDTEGTAAQGLMAQMEAILSAMGVIKE